jgi:hypothetical protein
MREMWWSLSCSRTVTRAPDLALMFGTETVCNVALSNYNILNPAK